MAADISILLSHVSKTFSDKHRTSLAVRDVSFEVRRGTVLGILGANGAGKTTLIKMMSTQLAPSEGKISVLGLDTVDNARQMVLSQSFMLFQLLSDFVISRFKKLSAGPIKYEH